MQFTLLASGLDLIENGGLPFLTVTGFEIGEAFDFTVTGDEIGAVELAFREDQTFVKLSRTSNANVLHIVVQVPANVEGFAMGNVVIFVDDVAFCLLKFDREYTKTSAKLIVSGTLTHPNISEMFHYYKVFDTLQTLPPSLTDNPVWSQLAATMTTRLNEDVVKIRKQLSEIRNPDGLDRKMLTRTNELLGFSFQNDRLTDDDLNRFATYVSKYWPEAGTRRFIDFISYVKDWRLSISQLWTNDYRNFVDAMPPEARPVWENGDWYLTSHVNLTYDMFRYPDSDSTDLMALFYTFAPIHLVLHWLISVAYFEFDWLAVPDSGSAVQMSSTRQSKVSYTPKETAFASRMGVRMQNTLETLAKARQTEKVVAFDQDLALTQATTTLVGNKATWRQRESVFGTGAVFIPYTTSIYSGFLR